MRERLNDRMTDADTDTLFLHMTPPTNLERRGAVPTLSPFPFSLSCILSRRYVCPSSSAAMRSYIGRGDVVSSFINRCRAQAKSNRVRRV